MKKGIKLLLMVLAVLMVISLVDISYSAYRNDAEYLTKAFYGPFAYRDEIYVLSDLSTFPTENDTDVLDYIHEDISDFFTVKRLFYKNMEGLPELIGDETDSERNYLKVRMETDNYAAKASELEKSGSIDQVVEQFDEFIIWECKEKHYGLEELEQRGVDDGYELQRASLDQQYVKNILEAYENTELRQEDFRRDNTVYLLLAGTADMSDFLREHYQGVYRVPGTSEGYIKRNPHFYVGVLFLEDGKLYFCNYENEVEGQLKDVVLERIKIISEA